MLLERVSSQQENSIFYIATTIGYALFMIKNLLDAPVKIYSGVSDPNFPNNDSYVVFRKMLSV